MIKFQSDIFELDCSAYGVSLNEENDIFTDNIHKKYSLPGTITDPELISQIAILMVDNISGPVTKIKGRLLFPDRHFPATLFLGEIKGQRTEFSFTYGGSDLAIMDTPLKDLPWPKIIQLNIANYANTVKNLSWPATAFNFPMLYKPEIAEKTNYAAFEKFVNNHNGTVYLENSVNNEGAEPVYLNKNVLAPFPYLLEIVRFGFLQEGKRIFGEVLENPVLKKALYIPKNYLEKFRGNEYVQFSFSTPTGTETVFDRFVYGVYEKKLTPTSIGTYEIDFNLNLDPVLADYFEFNIYREDALSAVRTNIYQALSEKNRVRIEEKFTVNIETNTQFDHIVIQLKLRHTPENISAFNNFEYSFKGGQLNEYPSIFSLANFMPDMTFGEYLSTLETWLNMEIEVHDNYAELKFIQNSILKKHTENHEHLEIPGKVFKYNSNRLYRLSYANGEKVLYNINGQIYSDLDEEGDEIIDIEMKVAPAIIESNENVITAVAPAEASKIDFCVYDGPVNGKPVCSATLQRLLSLQNVFKLWWELWLSFRVRSKTYKESFECSVYERIFLEELSRKYNELHLIRKLSKKYVSEQTMKVEIESETF